MPDTDATLKQSLKQQAVKDLEAWYEERGIAISKQKSQNRLGEIDTPETRSAPTNEPVGSQWERVCDMVDFQKQSTKDTSRMKSVLLSLKNAPPVS